MKATVRAGSGLPTVSVPVAVTSMRLAVSVSMSNMPVRVPSGEEVAEQTPSPPVGPGSQPWSTVVLPGIEFQVGVLAAAVLAGRQVDGPN